MVTSPRLQEAAEKLPQVRPHCKRHFIGHLQRNKVRDVLSLFDLIQSVDSKRLALEVDKRAALKSMKVKILLQVNTSGEETLYGPVRAGVGPDALSVRIYLPLIAKDWR